MSQLEILAPFRAILTAKLNIYFQTPNNYEENYRISQKFQPLQAPHGAKARKLHHTHTKTPVHRREPRARQKS